MEAQQQKIKIAEACGWTPHSALAAGAMWFRPGEKHRLLERTLKLPDYFGDLNAMHEAEKVLTNHQQMMMYHALTKVLRKADSNLTAWRASAAQRAEAFLRALNLWEDGA